MKKLHCILWIVCAGLIARAQNKVSLRIGDTPPVLKYSKWIKGQPFTTFDKDKVYVLEFWATWCGPCRAAMPHLTKLQKQYEGKISIIGIDIWEDKKSGKPHDAFIPTVEKFVTENSANMGYSVMVDNNEQHMGNNWMKAAGQEGIPSTFIIKQNKIVWIGGPSALDEVIPKVLDGSYSMDANKAQIERGVELANKQTADWLALSGPIRKALDAKQYEKAFVLIDETVGKHPNYKTVFYIWKFNALMRHEKPEQTIAFGNRWLKEDANAIYPIMTGLSKEDGLDKSIYKWAAETFENLKGRSNNDVFTLHELARVFAKAGDFKQAVLKEERAVSIADAELKSEKNSGVITIGILNQYKAALKDYKAKLSQGSAPSFRITGKLTGASAVGKMVYLKELDYKAKAIDSTLIGAGGNFHFAGSLPFAKPLSLVLKGGTKPLQQTGDPTIVFFAENADIHVEGNYDSLLNEPAYLAIINQNLSKAITIKGSKSHDQYLKYYEGKSKGDELRASAMEKYSRFLTANRGKAVKKVTEAAAITKTLDSIDQVRKDFSIKYVLENPSSEVLVYIADQTLTLQNLTTADIDKLSKKIAGSQSSGPLAKVFLEKAAVVRKGAIGSKFIDFAFKGLDEKTYKLSSFIGKGNYVLLELWASWCGPCRADIPHLKEVYNAYNPKGFEIISISLDKKKEDWLKALKEEELNKWPQLVEPMADKSELAKAYRITAIPACLLFDPQGNLVTYNMRGSFMDVILIKLYGDHFLK